MTTKGTRAYGVWAGLPNGVAEDLRRCVVEVKGHERWPSYYQCSKPRGKGPDGLYCTLHAKRIAKGKPVDVPKEGAALPIAETGSNPCLPQLAALTRLSRR